MVYSKDIRWLAILMKFGENRSLNYISRVLKLSKSTITRIIKNYRTTGSVNPKQLGRPPISTLMTRDQQFVLWEYILKHSTSYLKEMKQYLHRTTGSDISVTSIYSILKRFRYTRKRLHRIALNIKPELVEKFKDDVKVFRPEELVFLDESFCDRRISRNYGFSWRGKRARGKYASPHGPRVSVMAAIGHNGLMCFRNVVKKPFNSRRFLRFLTTDLAPLLNRYNGRNNNSVVIMDNHPAHHVPGVRAVIENTGAMLLYLPPYSPQLNPIEGIFSTMKQWLRTHDKLLMITDDPEYLVYKALIDISPTTVRAYYSGCGYH